MHSSYLRYRSQNKQFVLFIGSGRCNVMGNNPYLCAAHLCPEGLPCGLGEKKHVKFLLNWSPSGRLLDSASKLCMFAESPPVARGHHFPSCIPNFENASRWRGSISGRGMPLSQDINISLLSIFLALAPVPRVVVSHELSALLPSSRQPGPGEEDMREPDFGSCREPLTDSSSSRGPRGCHPCPSRRCPHSRATRRSCRRGS